MSLSGLLYEMHTCAQGRGVRLCACKSDHDHVSHDQPRAEANGVTREVPVRAPSLSIYLSSLSLPVYMLVSTLSAGTAGAMPHDSVSSCAQLTV